VKECRVELTTINHTVIHIIIIKIVNSRILTTTIQLQKKN